jgi:hypothetical protein
VNRYHYIFWYGDLNYRIDLPFETVIESINKNQLVTKELRDAGIVYFTLLLVAFYLSNF